MIKTAKRLGNVQEYYFSQKLREIATMNAAGKDVLNLGIGSPDLAPPAEAITELVMQSQKPNTHAYQSYSGLPALRKAFATWYAEFFKVTLDPESEVMPLIGSKEGIMHISMTYLEVGDGVLVPNPGYPTYRSVANLTGATVIDYDLKAENGWLPDLEALERQDLSKVKIMWVNYPNMPTGTKADKNFFKSLIAFAKKHNILIINDNPYSFVLNEEQFSIFSITGAREVALELNSLSKSHNMAGWRIGMLAGKADYLKTILRFKSNMDSGMYKPAQLAAIQALAQPRSWYDNLNDIYKKRRVKVFELMDLIGATYDEDQVGMFVWARIPKGFADCYSIADKLLAEANVFITPGGIFGTNGDQFIRTSLCNEVDVFEEAIDRVRQII